MSFVKFHEPPGFLQEEITNMPSFLELKKSVALTPGLLRIIIEIIVY